MVFPRAMIVTFVLALSVPALAQDKQMTREDFGNAERLAEKLARAEQAIELAESASQIGITIEGVGMSSRVVVSLDDPEWDTVLQVVKDVAARQEATATTDLKGMGFTVVE